MKGNILVNTAVVFLFGNIAGMIGCKAVNLRDMGDIQGMFLGLFLAVAYIAYSLNKIKDEIAKSDKGIS